MKLKKELHADEIYSVMLANNIKYYWAIFYDGSYTGAELKNKIFNNDVENISTVETKNVDDFSDDLYHLWLNNGDTPHASLYYMMLRISFFISDLISDSPKDVDVGKVVKVGGVLNLLLFAISFFVMLKLLKLLVGNKMILILLGLVVAFSTTTSIENTLLIREYQTAEIFVIILTLVSVSYIKNVTTGRTINYKNYLIGFTISIVGLLSSGYLNSIYILLFGVVLIFVAFRHGRKKDLILIVGSAIIGLVIAWAIYIGFFNFLIHKTVHTSRAFESPLKVLNHTFVRDITTGTLTIYGVSYALFLTIILLFNGRFKSLFKLDSFVWLPLIAVASIYLVQYTAVLKMSRYSYPLLPIVALILPLLLRIVDDKITKFFSVAITIYYLLMPLINPVVKYYGWAYMQRELSSGATIYKLNSTEIAQIIPCLNDTATYRIQNTDFANNGNYPDRVVMKHNCRDIAPSSIKERRRLVGRHIDICTTQP